MMFDVSPPPPRGRRSQIHLDPPHHTSPHLLTPFTSDHPNTTHFKLLQRTPRQLSLPLTPPSRHFTRPLTASRPESPPPLSTPPPLISGSRPPRPHHTSCRPPLAPPHLPPRLHTSCRRPLAPPRLPSRLHTSCRAPRAPPGLPSHSLRPASILDRPARPKKWSPARGMK